MSSLVRNLGASADLKRLVLFALERQCRVKVEGSVRRLGPWDEKLGASQPVRLPADLPPAFQSLGSASSCNDEALWER